MTLGAMATALGGRLVGGPSGRVIRGITTRPKFATEDMALVLIRPHPRGEMITAVRRGSPIIATRVQARSLPAGAATVIVANPRRAYRDFAHHYRMKLGVPVIAVTGTAGKTTTKEMLRAMLARQRQVIATAANYNANPAFTILSADAATDALILEMGMDRPGQIAAQCRVAEPDIGIITNVGRAHVERCGGFMGVVRAKNEMVYGIRRGGTLVLNADDAGSRLLDTSTFNGRILRIGRDPGADYRLVGDQLTPEGTAFAVAAEGYRREFVIPAAGEHLVYDALAAMAAARSAGASWDEIRYGLAHYATASGRLTYRQAKNGAVVIDDTFNANPLSVAAALRTLAGTAAGKRTIAMLGNMEEQGAGWRDSHRQIGAVAAKVGVDYLITVGAKAAEIAAGAASAGFPRGRIHTGRTKEGAVRVARSWMTADSVVLVKGSHSVGMYQIARSLAPRKA